MQTKKYLKAIVTSTKMLQLYYSATKMILILKQRNHGLSLDIVIFILDRLVCLKISVKICLEFVYSLKTICNLIFYIHTQ